MLTVPRRGPQPSRLCPSLQPPVRTGSAMIPQTSTPRRATPRLRVERLEDRSLPAVIITVNAALDRHAINPLIYGTAFATTAQLLDLNSPFNRSGGNATTRYNWELNATSRAGD